MSIEHIIGITMLSALFVGLFAVCAVDIGMRRALIVFSISVGITAYIALSVFLVFG